MLEQGRPLRGRSGNRMSRIAKLVLACLLCLALVTGLVLIAQRAF